MKRIITLILVAIISFNLTACGKTNRLTKITPPPPSPELKIEPKKAWKDMTLFEALKEWKFPLVSVLAGIAIIGSGYDKYRIYKQKQEKKNLEATNRALALENDQLKAPQQQLNMDNLAPLHINNQAPLQQLPHLNIGDPMVYSIWHNNCHN